MRSKLFVLISLFLIQVQFAQDSLQSVSSDSVVRFSYSTISELHDQLEDIFNDQSFRNANWGVVIQSLDNGEYFYKRNEDKFFVPASNLKLFVTAAGLLLLTPNYRYPTKIYLDGYRQNSTLYGDIVIQGYGDPTISGRFYEGDLDYVLDTWIDSLLEDGIRNIKGNIIGDDNLFEDVGLGRGWAWDYESDWYAAQSSALSFNDNCIDLYIYYDSTLDSIIVESKPDYEMTTVINDLRLANPGEGSDVQVYRERGTDIVKVFGRWNNTSDTLKTYVTVNNPTQFLINSFKKRIEERGIRINGNAYDIDEYNKPIDYQKMTLLFTTYSNELSEIVKVINKGSQNFFAEQLLKTIGFEKKGYGSVDNGVEACKEIFAEIGLNTDNIVMEDGSGLSPLNMVTPKQITELLKYMYFSDLYSYFYNSLPIAGVDGTLGKRLKGTTAENVIRAKTGYISHVRSLSGYAFTGDKEPVVFSMIANNFNVPVKLAENIQDLVCLRITNFRRR